MELEISKSSNVGGRNCNEDFCSYSQAGKYYCLSVADGLGGHRGGQVASKIAVETLERCFNIFPEISENKLIECLLDAQNALIKKQDEKLELLKMRTTIATVVMNNDSAICAHIGDTRVYHFKKGRIIFQTKDHSVPQTLVNAGELSEDQIRFHEDRNKITRVLGDRSHFKPKIDILENIESNDALLLCTDGFWEYVVENDMEEDLNISANPSIWIDKMKMRLLKLAKANNDNYSAIAVFIK